MKSLKILTIILILLLIVFLPVQAKKKVPPIPLKELTDPNSPSYVPYPYPKTEFEIIEDFKYGVKVHFGAREGKRTSVLRAYKNYVDRQQQIILGLLGDKPNLKIAEIIKVQNLIDTSPSLFYFLLRIVNKKGDVVAVGSLNDCGLFGGVSFFSEKKAKFKPFKTEKKVEEIITHTLGPTKINKMERIALHSTICDPHAPLWKISTPAGVYFVDYFDNVYSIESEIFWTSDMNFPDPEHQKISIMDTLNDKIIFLKKIKKK